MTTAEINGQLSLFEETKGNGSQKENPVGDDKKMIKVVNATFTGCEETCWEELFSGFDRLYGITFSSGIHFLDKIISQFSYAAMADE